VWVLNTWIDLARGPLFRAALTFALVGLLRHVVLTVRDMRRVLHRAADRQVPYRQVLVVTLRWLFPVDRVRQRFAYSLTSVAFHVAIILTPLFLAGHIALVASTTGWSWWSLRSSVADVLTLVAVLTALLLVIQRASAPDSRSLSHLQDYVLPLVIAVPFAAGFLMMHPAWNPFPYEVTFLTHVASADLVLVLLPVTKLRHMALLPATQLVSELAWHFPPDAGTKVGVALGREGQPI
jgi:nitrate reductase gamma subunit